MDNLIMKLAMRKTTIFFLLLASVFLGGCGKKGALIPPEALVPAAVAEPLVAQRGDSFRISWSAPTREQSGRPLRGGVRYRLQRRVVLPLGQDCTACPDVWKLLGEFDPAVPGGMERSGSRYTYVDRELLPETTYQYRLQVIDSSGGLSRLAVLPPLKRLTPPFPPVLQAAPGSAGVHLEFVAPTAARRESAVGYLLFRQDGTNGTLIQLTPSPLAGAVYDDAAVRLGATYRYTARTVATIGDQVVESADSNEAIITVTLPE